MNIPTALTALPCWVIWRKEKREDKWTKVPYQARRPDARASATDPATWSTFKVAVEAAGYEEVDGVGFVFARANGIVGIDLDKCIDQATNVVEDWAAAIVRGVNSYTEVTPSGTGLHIIAFGTLPAGSRRRGRIEIYDDARYFTVTGIHVGGTPTTVEARDAALSLFHTALFPPSEPLPLPAPTPIRPMNGHVNGAGGDVVARARQASNGAKFDRLWNGSAVDHGGDDSAADLALCQMLAFWTGRDGGKMDSLFRQSGRLRPKWDERHFSDGRTYGQATIAEALTNTREVYHAENAPGAFTMQSRGHLPI